LQRLCKGFALVRQVPDPLHTFWTALARLSKSGAAMARPAKVEAGFASGRAKD